MITLDTEIIELCKKNDRKAQMQLYKAFYKRIYNSCFRILRNSAEAEDAMQESFLKVFANLDSSIEPTLLEAWIVRIAINTSIDKLRKNRMEVIDFNENINYDIADNNESEEWEQIEWKVEKVKAAIKNLPGSSGKIKYLMSGGFAEETGILKINPDKYKRFDFRTKVSVDITDWLTISNNTSFFKSKYKWHGKADNFNVNNSSVTTNPIYFYHPAYVPVNPGESIPFFESNAGGRIVGVEISCGDALSGADKDILLQASWDEDKDLAINSPAADFFGYAYGKPAMQSLLAGSLGISSVHLWPTLMQ